MRKAVPSPLKALFFVHGVAALLFGLLLWLVPGRSLTLLGWVPEQVMLPESDLLVPGATFVNPVFVRVLGAALLALGFSSLRAWRADFMSQVRLLVQMEAVFCVLGTMGVGAGVYRFEQDVPTIGWIFLGVLLLFSAAWLMAWSVSVTDPPPPPETA